MGRIWSRLPPHALLRAPIVSGCLVVSLGMNVFLVSASQHLAMTETGLVRHPRIVVLGMIVCWVDVPQKFNLLDTNSF